MLFNKRDAIAALAFNNMNPEILMNQLRTRPNTITIYKDESDIVWKFTARRQYRMYLMAKMDCMDKYEEIYWVKTNV